MSRHERIWNPWYWWLLSVESWRQWSYFGCLYWRRVYPHSTSAFNPLLSNTPEVTWRSNANRGTAAHRSSCRPNGEEPSDVFPSQTPVPRSGTALLTAALHNLLSKEHSYGCLCYSPVSPLKLWLISPAIAPLFLLCKSNLKCKM